MKYTLEWMEKKTTSMGKTKADCTLKDEQGIVVEKVTIWGDWPAFDTLMPGSEVEGTLTPAKDPRYGPTLYPIRSNLGPKPASLIKQETIKQAQTVKREDIRTAQERTQEAVAMSGSARDASLILTAFYPTAGLDEDGLKAKWEEWRKWLYGKYSEPFV